MTRLGWLVAAACCGCFVKPEPGSGGTCSSWGSWSTTPIPLTGTAAFTGGENGPWLSDDRTEVWFTGRSASSDDVVRAQLVAGTWTLDPRTPAIDTSAAQDDPFVDRQNRLWYASNESGPFRVYEVARTDTGAGVGTPMVHDELLDAQEPTVSADGGTIIFSNGTTELSIAHRAGNTGSFGSPQPLAFAESIQSPSLDTDGTTLYFTTHQYGADRIAVGEVSGSTLTAADDDRVLPFQTEANEMYYDPSISRDGTTLAFTSTLGGNNVAHLYYVTRACGK